MVTPSKEANKQTNDPFLQPSCKYPHSHYLTNMYSLWVTLQATTSLDWSGMQSCFKESNLPCKCKQEKCIHTQREREREIERESFYSLFKCAYLTDKWSKNAQPVTVTVCLICKVVSHLHTVIFNPHSYCSLLNKWKKSPNNVYYLSSLHKMPSLTFIQWNPFNPMD